MNWLVFSYSLPGKSGSGPRVNLWRRLRRLGAISPAGGAQVLPARDECLEAFQWLAREIRQAKGEAVVMRVEQFEGLTDQQLIDRFHAAREEDYAEIERSSHGTGQDAEQADQTGRSLAWREKRWKSCGGAILKFAASITSIVRRAIVLPTTCRRSSRSCRGSDATPAVDIEKRADRRLSR